MFWSRAILPVGVLLCLGENAKIVLVSTIEGEAVRRPLCSADRTAQPLRTILTPDERSFTEPDLESDQDFFRQRPFRDMGNGCIPSRTRSERSPPMGRSPRFSRWMRRGLIWSSACFPA